MTNQNRPKIPDSGFFRSTALFPDHQPELFVFEGFPELLVPSIVPIVAERTGNFKWGKWQKEERQKIQDLARTQTRVGVLEAEGKKGKK